MILALTAAAVTGYRARLTLTVTDSVAGTTINLYRDDLSGVLVPVLGGTGLLPASTVLDDVPALNRPTWWRAIASASGTGVTRTNACTNPRLGTDTYGWWSNGALSRVNSGGKWWAEGVTGAYLYATVSGVVGHWYAASFRVSGPVGATFTSDSTDNVLGSWIQGAAFIIPTSGEMVVTCLSGNAAGGVGLRVGISGPSAPLMMTEVLIEEVSGPGMAPGGPYFDGSTAAAGDYTYVWTGTANASTSTQQGPAVAITPTPVTVASDLPVLADPRGGVAVQVTVAEWTEITIDGTATPVQVDVEDTADDATVWILGPDGARTATVTLRADADQLATVRQILASGRPMLLRGSQPGLEDPWLIGRGRRERRVTNNVTDWRRYLVLDVGIPTGAPDPTVPVMGDTLGDLAAAVPTTLADIAATWATLGDIAAADLKAM